MSVDLNLENYDLQDLLNLFKLDYNFNINDLKAAKKIVLQTHPDKSGLDKEFFLFYCKAFRIIKKIYDFRNKKSESLNSNNSKVEYLAETDEDIGNRILIDNLLKKDNLDFNKWFNKTFEKINIIDDERRMGYGDWFKTDEDIDTTSTTLNMMHQRIDEKKKAMSALIKKNDICELSSSTIYQGLDGNIPDSYGSNIFSKLSYEDLKVAHTETVVPVCENDYNNVLKFNNVEVLRSYRNNQNIKPMSNTETNKYFANKIKAEDKTNTRLAYRLAKQDEEMEKANKTWWANLKLLQ